MEKKCLVVDDVEVSRFSLMHFLSELNVSVDVACTVKEAYSKLNEKSFDAIFVDWHIGRDSGIDFIKKIKSELSVKAPIFVISGVENAGAGPTALQAGAHAFIEKPTEKSKLESCLKSVHVI